MFLTCCNYFEMVCRSLEFKTNQRDEKNEHIILTKNFSYDFHIQYFHPFLTSSTYLYNNYSVFCFTFQGQLLKMGHFSAHCAVELLHKSLPSTSLIMLKSTLNNSLWNGKFFWKYLTNGPISNGSITLNECILSPMQL